MSYPTISPLRLASSLLLVVIALFVVRRLRLRLERDLLIGALRATVQLVGVGFVLVFLLGHDHWWATLVALTVMIAIASFTSARRVEHGPGTLALWPHTLLAIVVGGAFALVPVFSFIAPVDPPLSTRFVVPVAGMVLANSMNVVALVLERIFAAASTQSSEIEQLLALGATPKQALETQVIASVRAALIPTINGLLTAGVVALPGMMSGQILAGVAPGLAVRWQLVILFQLVVVAAISGALAAVSARGLLFTRDAQLSLPKTNDQP